MTPPRRRRSPFDHAVPGVLVRPVRDQPGPRSELRTRLADALQRVRLAAGMSQAAISGRARWELKQSQISQLLRGELDARLSTWVTAALAIGFELDIALKPTGEPWWVVTGDRFTMTCPCGWGWKGPAAEIDAAMTLLPVDSPPQPWIVLWTTQGARTPTMVASHVASCKKAQAVFRVEIV